MDWWTKVFPSLASLPLYCCVRVIINTFHVTICKTQEGSLRLMWRILHYLWLQLPSMLSYKGCVTHYFLYIVYIYTYHILLSGELVISQASFSSSVNKHYHPYYKSLYHCRLIFEYHHLQCSPRELCPKLHRRIFVQKPILSNISR